MAKFSAAQAVAACPVLWPPDLSGQYQPSEASQQTNSYQVQIFK